MWISLRFLFFSSFRTEKALHQDGLWCKASNFFSMFLCLFLMFSRVLRMARIFWFLQRRLSKKCQRGVPKNINYSNSQIKSYHYTLLYRNYGSIWFYMCSTVQSPQTVLNGVINLLSHLCYQSKILVISWYRLTTR